MLLNFIGRYYLAKKKEEGDEEEEEEEENQEHFNASDVGNNTFEGIEITEDSRNTVSSSSSN